MILTLRNRIKLLIYVAAALVLLVTTIENDGTFEFSLRRLTLLETGVFVVVSAFDRWLWRFPLILRLLRTGPLLRGTWAGEVTPTDGDTESVPAYLSVRQTFSGIRLRLMTAESTSESTTAQLEIQDDGLGVLEYAYRNVPRDSVRARSPIHHGAARIEASGARPQTINGSYFTDRRTTGEMRFTSRSKRVAHTVDDARRLFSSAE